MDKDKVKDVCFDKNQTPKVLSLVIGKTNVVPMDMTCMCLSHPPTCPPHCIHP